MSKLSVFAAGAVVAIVLGSGTAVAATGGKFILGHSNTETSPSTLSNTKGTALALKSKPGTPPLSVNSSTKVSSLNSDRLDGLDGSAFALKRGQAAALDEQGQPVDLDDPPDGVNDAVIAISTCPTGTQLTGGGATDSTDTGQIWSSAPDLDIPESWTVVVGIDAATEQHATDVYATAVCYNPRGPVADPNAYGFSARHVDPLSLFSAKRLERLREQAAARAR
jgi:hypothetical protein